MRPFRLSSGSLLRKVLISSVRGYLGLTLRTMRWTFTVDPAARKLLTAQDGHTAIVAFWHEALPLTPALWWWAEPQNPTLRLHVLISRNRDGRLIADIVAPWRIWSIAGSSDTRGKNKGGAAAIRRMRARLRHGGIVAITPDGPRGPRRQAQQGAAALAAMVKMPIVPVGATCSGFRLKSWDRMIVPVPFGKGRFVCGAPLFHLHADGRSAAEAGQLLSAAITDAMGQAEAAMRSKVRIAHLPTEEFRPQPLDLMPSRLWATAATFAAPALPFFLRWRQTRGKEIASRVREKMGFASQPRPLGAVIWFHAASVGEVVSILPLVENCLRQNARVTALMTTGTVTAARMVAQRTVQEARIVHQFVPLDVPRWGKRFLSHWRPQAAVFTESELWPNLIGLCHERNLPVALVNGRMSPVSFKKWCNAPCIARRMLDRFAWIAPRSSEDARHFEALGARNLLACGDLKTVAHALPVQEDALQKLQTYIGKRPLFLAASTHDGEEEDIRKSLEQLRNDVPDLLTLVVPRHPERGAVVSSLFSGAPRRSLGQLPEKTDSVWVCDTLGELGLFYRLAPMVFIGNSLPDVKGGGGHNPLEPARLDCALATGPLVHNFIEAFRSLGESVTVVETATDLAAWVRQMVSDPELRARKATLSQERVSAVNGDLIDRLTTRVLDLLKS